MYLYPGYFIHASTDMGQFHARHVEEVVSSLHADLSRGLTQQQVAERRKKFGPNILRRKKQKSLWSIFFEQFVNPIIWVLIIAGALAFAFQEVVEGITIIIVILITASIGFGMEWQALNSMTKLRQLGRAKSKVIRDGQRTEIDSANLVPGDLLYLEAGDMVTADARLTEQHNFIVSEATFTGESVPIEKQTDILPEDTIIAERSNTVFSGTVVTNGNANAVITATGNNTELGNIAEIAQDAEKEITPLDKRLRKLSRRLIWLTLAIAAFIVIVGIAYGREWLITVEIAIALAVAAIPEGLPVITTITLARGMIRLAEKNVIVKTLEAVQTLGETDVIFTDKTGTLTKNEMHLESLTFQGKTVDVAELQKNKATIPSNAKWILTTGVLCNNSTIPKNSDGVVSGDPNEIALLWVAAGLLDDPASIRTQYPRIAEIPFDADLKVMGTLHKSGDGYLVCAKGATGSILDRCDFVHDDRGENSPLGSTETWINKVDELSADGFRVLGFAYKELHEKPSEREFMRGLTFLGLGNFVDPVREEVVQPIQACKEAGINVIMVTGDHPETAGYIAQQTGLVENGRAASKVHGKQLLSIGDSSVRTPLLETQIFARINPAQKLNLVELFQQNNHVVGMTGDGVNDAPALKKADIGIAMGLRGTEAAKEAADIVLRDDSFSSIVLAIRQGRIIFENIRKFIVYLLSCNLSEILVVATASFFDMPLPLLPLQILFLNIVTDVFPALALGMGEGGQNIMKKKPKDPEEEIIPPELWRSIVSYGLGMTIAVVGIELVSLHVLQLPDKSANNMTFYTLILVQLWNVFNLPEASVSFIKNEVTKNKFVWLALLLCFLIVLMVWSIPNAREALSLVYYISPAHWGVIILFSFIPTLLIQTGKRILKIIN